MLWLHSFDTGVLPSHVASCTDRVATSGSESQRLQTTRDTTTMAPNPAASQHDQIRDMIQGGCTNAVIADAARCSVRAVQRIRSKLRCFGATKAPRTGSVDVEPSLL